MLPPYMFMIKYNILQVGAFFILAHLASIPLTYAIGKLFNRIPLRHGLVLIDTLEGFSCIFYELAYGPLAPLMLFTGMTINEIASIFYPLYQAVEKVLYTKDGLKEVFAWHMRLPEMS